jgi:hypothetical protein
MMKPISFLKTIINNSVGFLLTICVLHILPLFCATDLWAQRSIIVTGTIIDADSLRPIGFASIRAIGPQKKAAVSGQKGNYILRLLPGEYTFSFSSVGYKSESRTLNLYNQDTVRIDIGLKHSSFRSAEVIVSAEDPGVKLMRKVLQHKDSIRKSLESYSYMLYTKFIASTDTITAGRSSGRNDTTIFSIFESYSKGYFQKPDNFYNEILQRRQTANIPPQANFVAFGTNLNLYEDYISILGENIATPFHPDALDYYDFRLERISDDDSSQTATIYVQPRTIQRKLFTGAISINTQRLIPLLAELKPNKAVQLPFDASLTIQQTFGEPDSVHVLPTGMRINSSLSAEFLFILAPRLDVSIETVAYDYEINTTIPEGIFDGRRVEISEKAEAFDTIWWREKSVLPLRPEEAAAYIQIQRIQEDPDSLANNLLSNLLGDIARFTARLQRRPFTGIEDMLRYNRVHGAYLGLGLFNKIGNYAEYGLKAGYGFADKRVYGEALFRQFFDKSNKYSAEISLYRKLARRDNPYVVSTNPISLLSFLFHNDYGDYYYTSGAEFALEYGWGQLRFLRREDFIRPSAIRISLKREWHETALKNTEFSLFNRNSVEFRENPAAIAGHLNSIAAEFRLQFTPDRRISQAGFIIAAQHAFPIMNNGFQFSQAQFQSFIRLTPIPLWKTDIRVSSGWSNGAVPAQKFYSLESSVASTAGDGVFRGMNVKEFYGDLYAAISIEQNFGEIIPGVLRIPNLAAFGIEFILTGSMGWTSFSRNAMNIQNLPSTGNTPDHAYFEAGLALNRILFFLRADISARLSQRSVPGFRFTISAATF